MAEITTRKQAIKHLQKVGILTPTGKLSSHYKLAPVKKTSTKNVFQKV